MFSSKNKSYLLKKNQKALDNSSLDSGMGFEYLKGAILSIETVKTIIGKDKQEYSRSDYETEFIGKINEEEQNELIRAEQDYWSN